MHQQFKLVAFDLDDTLAESKSPIEGRMAGLLVRLLRRTDVCIISGGQFGQFRAQVLQRLPAADAELQRLHLLPTCGTRYYRYHNGDWEQLYAQELTRSDRDVVVAVLREGARSLGLWPASPAGEVIEDRGTQVTFSALGQSAAPAAKYAWDPDGRKKNALREYAAVRLPGLEVRSGGSTSIDVTRKGIDKAYGMRRLLELTGIPIEGVLFVGDRLDPAGNDYPVLRMGIRCQAVSGWRETAALVESLLTSEPASLVPAAAPDVDAFVS